ncbi:hypothetical protein EST38_g3444 [Candolleomyces aberdarensis]|uniref:DUF300-domain-containing protein n=1 Tax=Candolleomyces aberdarensis TaxID=2316362 RepID=A0A4Q2DS89_9AGAR|nr:hypothetical protein EST38_g3444 [Candolleomyces aberdarensis]
MNLNEGSKLPAPIILLAGISTIVAVVVSAWSIYLQLKNYRKPSLQRMVVRIMVMVPIYGISSLVSLHSVEAAFVIDAIRDIYEAFVIYCFFVLLLTYLGGERSLLIMLHGRPPKEPIFPLNIFKREIDVSDPYTFLFLKRGILQYVQIKPLLAAATLITKACGKYNEGDFRANSGYLYISIIYNLSICTSLYCLAMFWACVSDDLKPFRPVPKFLCVKGILFFSFWQSVGISILVAASVITKLGPYTDPEHVSTGWNNLFICVEMPLFAFAHMFAFSYKDYIDPHHTFVARMPFYYGFRDAFGLKDVVEDSKATLRGEGMDYREFEPAEGLMHQGVGRDRRMRAGLRYSRGGQKKYWLPKADTNRDSGLIGQTVSKIAPDRESVHAPLLERQAQSVVHLAPDMMQDRDDEPSFWGDPEVEDGYDLPFGDIDEADEELFDHSKRYLFGDYNYPCIDVSTESARRTMWVEEERVLRDERGAWFSPIRGAKGQEAIRSRDAPAWQGYGAVGTSQPPRPTTQSSDEIREVPGSRVIDYDQEREERAAASTSREGGVALKWTKKNQASAASSPSSRPSPHMRSSALNRVDSSSSAGSSSSKLRSPPALGSRPNSRSSPLPPDAVDLVVEDSHATEERAMDRRKAEPASRAPGLKKVYRRGFEAEASGGHRVKGEVEVEDPSHHDRRRVDAAEKIIHAIGDDGDDDGSEEREQSHVSSPWDAVSRSPEEAVVVTAEPPPMHARLEAYKFENIPGSSEHNPWA